MKKLIIIMLLLTACGNAGQYDMPAQNGERVYLGDSITEMCYAYTNGINRAYPGDTAQDTLYVARQYQYTDEGASYIILVGVNDVLEDMGYSYIYNMERILDTLNGHVEIITILPTRYPEINARIIELNNELYSLGVPIIDRYDEFLDSDGLLKVEYTTDGVHLTDEGCQLLYAS